MKLSPLKFNFSEISSELISKNIHIIGIPYDASTSYKPGTRFAPTAIRQASMNLEPYSPYLFLSLEDKKFYDLGDIEFEANDFEKLREYFNNSIKSVEDIRLVTLGGEHSISIFPIQKHLEAYSNLVLIHLDAHTDLRDDYHGDKNSHACVIKRAHDLFGPDHQLLQYGIRSGAKEEFEWMEKHHTLAKSRQIFFDAISSIPNEQPIYLTLDVDFFDPGIMPGTGTPEAGGEDFSFFISFVKLLKNKNLVGFDIVELNPMNDPYGVSEAMTAKIMRELLLVLK